MFTGIVQGMGEVVALEKRGGEIRLHLKPHFAWEKPRIGESVAVDGACLTLETWNYDGPSLTTYASEETVSHTVLGELRVGNTVNMEQALALGDRLGGHLVSGHVDAVARVESIFPVGVSRRIRLVFEEKWSSQIIPKGSVCLNGVSLTVNDCGPGYLEVNVIPETQESTTISNWKAGRRINFETDVIGKYVGHLLGPYLGIPAKNVPKPSALTMDFLRDNGF